MDKQQELINKYRDEDNPTPFKGGTLSEFVKVRYDQMKYDDSRTYNETLWKSCIDLKDVYFKEVTSSESFTRSVRLPHAQNIIDTLKDELLESPPSVVVTAKDDDSEDAAKKAKVLQVTREKINMGTYAQKAHAEVTDSMLTFGQGVKYKGYLKKECDGKVEYDDLVSMHVDPRHFLTDEKATEFYDPTGSRGARDCIWVRSFPLTTFIEFAKAQGFKNIGAIQAAANDITAERARTIKEEDESRDTVPYVYVADYYNHEENIRAIVSQVGGQYVEHYTGELPEHRRLPFVMYYTEKRPDSIYGVPIIQKLAPIIRAKEILLNLAFDEAKLALQKVTVVDGNSGYNQALHVVQPGAVWELRSIDGDVRKAVQQLEFGGISQDFYNLNSMFDDEMTIASNVDRRSMFLSPNELATQTKKKAESMKKRIRSIVRQNVWRAEKESAEIDISNIKEYLAPKMLYTREDGTKGEKNRRYLVEGYVVSQEDSGARIPEFISKPGHKDYLYLTEEGVDVEGEVSVVDAAEKSALDEDFRGRLLQGFTATINALQLPIPEAQKLREKLDLVSYTAKVNQSLGIDKGDIFIDDEKDTLSQVELEHEAMAAEQDVPLPPTEKPEESKRHLRKHLAFGKSERFKEFTRKSEQKWAAHNAVTMENAIKLPTQEPAAPQSDPSAPQAGGQAPPKVSQPPTQLESSNSIPGQTNPMQPPTPRPSNALT